MLLYGEAGCTHYHMVRGEGGHPWPDLTISGVTLNLARIREGLLDPSKGFDPVIATLGDGVRIAGGA